MPQSRTTVAVLTADIIGSSKYSPPDRNKLDRVLRAAFSDTERRFKGAFHTRMTFRITAGDEFQCVIANVGQAFDIVTHLRAIATTAELEPAVRFRASLGVGQLSTPKRKSSYEEDGTAFLYSRRGLEELVKGRGLVRWMKIVTGDQQRDRAIDTVLCLTDFVQQSWTVAQWEAVRWSLLGSTREAIAKRLDIAHQNVTKRLMAAGWPCFSQASAFLRDELASSRVTWKRVHNVLAPR